MSCLKYWGWILLFLAMCIISIIGLLNLIFMLPIPDFGTGSLNWPFAARLGACVGGTVLVSIGFYKYCKQTRRLKENKAALLALSYLDSDSFEALEDVVEMNKEPPIPIMVPPWENLWHLIYCNLDQYEPKRDLVQGLTLLMHDTISKYPVGSHLVYQELYELNNCSPARALKRLDNLILSHLNDDIKREFPREVYFLRRNLLGDYCGAYSEGRHLVYNVEECLYDYAQDEAVWQFCKHVLNEFYATHDDLGGYTKQPVSLDLHELQKRFSEVAQEGRANSKRIIQGSWLRPQMLRDERIPHERWKDPLDPLRHRLFCGDSNK